LKAFIELIEDKFLLNLSGQIQTHIKFQLNYLGFEKELNQDNKYTSDLEELDLVNLIKYFTDNEINLDLSKNTQTYLDNILKNKRNFEDKIKLLSSLKDNIETEDFNNFSHSLSHLKRKLKPHQIKSCYHLFKAESAANFSVPGSGKTSVVLAFYEKLKKENKINGIFVIGPKICYYSWKTEFILTLDRDPHLKILDEKFKDRKQVYENLLENELIGCHFATVTNDIEYLIKFFKRNKLLLVIDEAHNIKKIGGIWSQAVLQLSNLTDYKVILTGTPMPNNFKDFYNYLDFLYSNNEIINSREKAQIEIFMDNKDNENAENLIRQKIYPFYSLVSKRELNLSKPIFNKPIEVKMNPIENKIHEAILSKIKYYSNSDYEKNIDLINKIYRARLIRLRQVCSYVGNLITAIPSEIKPGEEQLIDQSDIKNLIASYENYEKPAKLSELLSIVKKLSEEKKKVLIWSTHLLTIDLIMKELLENGLNVKKITGKTELDERETIKNEFNDFDSPLDAIVAIPQACSESISLHKACHDAVYYDLNYNTAEFLQSLDRIHRVGGSEDFPVNYYFLHYENSIESKIYERVFQKANQQMKVIDKDNLTFSPDEEEDDYEEFFKSLNL